MKYAQNEKSDRPASGTDAGRSFCFRNEPKKEVIHNRQEESYSQAGAAAKCVGECRENETFAGMRRRRSVPVEIEENSFEWEVVPREEVAAEIEARFRALDREREVHYACRAAAGVLPEESPFPREREWSAMRELVTRNR